MSFETHKPLEDCPRCIDEKLIKTIGNVAVCPNCDLTVIVRGPNDFEVTLPPQPEAA